MDMEFIKKLRKNTPLAFLSGGGRLNLTLLGGSIVNLVYIMGNVASAVIYHSLFSATLTLYHLTLIIIRIYLLSAVPASLDNRRIARVCIRVGILLLLLDVTAAFFILFTVSRGMFVSYSGVIFLGFTVYATYSLTSSTLAMKRHANENNHLFYAARNITLATALMSFFNLQYSFFSYLGIDPSIATPAILGCGALVFSLIFAMAVRLIVKSRGLLIR